MEYLLDKILDVGLGIVTTFLGIVVIYGIARPSIELGAAVGASRQGRATRYRVTVRSRGTLPLASMRIIAGINVKYEKRTTTVPVPLSRSEWTGLRRRKKGWHAVPRLLLSEVQWKRHLPPSVRVPRRLRSSLPELLEFLDGELVITVISTSEAFGVTTTKRRRYSRGDVRPSSSHAEGRSPVGASASG